MNAPLEIFAIFAGVLMTVQFAVFTREIFFHQKYDETPARDYMIARLKSGIAGIFLDGALFLIWILGASSVLLYGYWLGTGASGHGQEIAVLVTVVLVQTVVHRLLSAYRQFVIERRFGFGRMTVGLFLRDTCVQGILLIAVALVLAGACVGVLSRFGFPGWFGVWLLWLAFTVGKSWGYPILIAPWFNRFSALDDEDLVASIDTLMANARCGLAKVEVMDGSRRSSHGNAHVTGLGSAKRVVLLDTLLKTLKNEEIVAVLAHELGHIVHAHISKFEGLKALISLVWIMGAGLIFSFLELFDKSPLGPGAALATLWLATPVFSIIARPLLTWAMRRFEYQADAFVVSHDKPEALSEALLKLHKRNASVERCDPVFGFIYASHPSLPDRLARLELQQVR